MGLMTNKATYTPLTETLESLKDRALEATAVNEDFWAAECVTLIDALIERLNNSVPLPSGPGVWKWSGSGGSTDHWTYTFNRQD